jgi:hypothetical protein
VIRGSIIGIERTEMPDGVTEQRNMKNIAGRPELPGLD